jgi:hypothetical protein
MMTARKFVALLWGMAFVATPITALARGTALVQHSNGKERLYQVSITVIDHRAVRIKTADGRGVLEVGKAGCSYVGDLERCLPYRITLEQFGSTRAIEVSRGIEYLNRTGGKLALPLSSDQVPPHGMLLFIVTMQGTHITVRGTVDGMSA